MRHHVAAAMILLAAIGCHGGGHTGGPECGGPHNLPPDAMLMHPGPGVTGPGPGVLGVPFPPPQEGMVAATSQISFLGPDGMQVRWDVGAHGLFDSEPLVCPGRYNFPQGSVYRIKLTSIPGRAGVELYPTVEVAPVMPRTVQFLTHSAIPVQFTQEDLDQVQAGNFVTKVIYVPDAEYQGVAVADEFTLVSTLLEPGEDPVVEADRRGSILAIVRLGNKDLQAGGGAPQGDIVPTAHQEVIGSGEPAGGPLPMAMGPAFMGGPQPQMVAGYSAPPWGMPITGTPIGLPGPPHIPLGVPAGLRRHSITNHTHVQMPEPVQDFRVHVKQKPGMSYPTPPNTMHILEEHHGPKAGCCPSCGGAGCNQCGVGG